MKKYFPLFIFSIYVFTGCQKIINKDLPAQQSKLVSNCLFATDTLTLVHLTKSLKSLDSSTFPEVTDATVSIFEGSTLSETLTHLYEGYYTSLSFKPQVGKSYKMVVKESGVPDAEATSSPSYRVGLTVDFHDSASVGERGEPMAELLLHFTDPAGIKNFYEVSISHFDTAAYLQNPDEAFIQSRFRSSDPMLEETSDASNIFKDETIDGKAYNLKLSIRSTDYNQGKQLHVVLRCISEEYYKYVKSYSNYQNNRDNPFSEPVQVYTNFKNGFGIFAGYSESLVVIH